MTQIGPPGRRPAALGVGVPGLVDTRTGHVKFVPNLPTQWRGVPAGAFLEHSLRMPVRLLNDARCATLGELIYGHGREYPTFVLFTLSLNKSNGISVKLPAAETSEIRDPAGTVTISVTDEGTIAWNKDLITLGAYTYGTDPKIDYAIDKIEDVNTFLKQATDEGADYDETVQAMVDMFADAQE